IGFLGYAPNNECGHNLYVSDYSQDKGEDYQETAVPGESVSSEIVLKNPTFQELRDFILRDPTSRNKFVLYKYECRHFATEVCNNADATGIRCAFVLLCFDRGQHAVVAFETTDRGLVYIEPQTDARIHPEVGGKNQGKDGY
ncbi:unnamed protein product, partial [marine sediment metagenome]